MFQYFIFRMFSFLYKYIYFTNYDIYFLEYTNKNLDLCR